MFRYFTAYLYLVIKYKRIASGSLAREGLFFFYKGLLNRSCYNTINMSDDKAAIERTAKRLRKARRAKHLTQVEVASNAGISETYYVQIEGAKKNPTTSVFNKIIKVIGVSSKEILGE